MTTIADWKIPDAKQILRADAPRPEWLGKRRVGLGGSDMAVVTGQSTYSGQSPYLLWMDKTNPEPPVETENDLFWFGQEVEPILAERFTADTGIATRRTGMWQSKAHTWAIANPDRLTADGGILEIKTTTRWTDNGKQYLAGEIPDAHLTQITHYMLVTGRLKAHVIALVDREVIILSVGYDPEYAQQLATVGAEFWNSVTTKTPPPINPLTATEEEVKARFPADTVDPDSAVEAMFSDMTLDDVAQLDAAKEGKKALDARIKEIETRLKAELGDREFLTVNGKPVVRWRTNKGKRSFDADAVVKKIAADRGVEETKKNLADIKDEFMKTGNAYRTFTLVGGAA